MRKSLLALKRDLIAVVAHARGFSASREFLDSVDLDDPYPALPRSEPHRRRGKGPEIAQDHSPPGRFGTPVSRPLGPTEPVDNRSPASRPPDSVPGQPRMVGRATHPKPSVGPRPRSETPRPSGSLKKHSEVLGEPVRAEVNRGSKGLTGAASATTHFERLKRRLLPQDLGSRTGALLLAGVCSILTIILILVLVRVL